MPENVLRLGLVRVGLDAILSSAPWLLFVVVAIFEILGGESTKPNFRGCLAAAIVVRAAASSSLLDRSESITSSKFVSTSTCVSFCTLDAFVVVGEDCCMGRASGAGGGGMRVCFNRLNWLLPRSRTKHCPYGNVKSSFARGHTYDWIKQQEKLGFLERRLSDTKFIRVRIGCGGCDCDGGFGAR